MQLSSGAAGALLEVRGLARAFGGLAVLQGIDLTLAPSAMLCLIGPNGCGKTTLFRLLSGELAADGGSMRLNGQDLRDLPPHAIARAGLVRKFQTPAIWPGLSVAENLAVPLFADAGRRGLLGLLSRRRTRDAEELLALVGLAALADLPAGRLAHGQRQWLEIAILLATGPRLLLLDEPTAGMTPAETRRTARLLQRLQAQAGIASLVIEHDLAFVRELGAPVAVMMKGRIVREGGYDEVRADPLVRELYLGGRA